jgi:hypothetical protein
MAKKKKKNPFVLITVIVLIVAALAVTGVLLFMKKDDPQVPNNTVQEPVSVNDPYSIRSNATDYQKELYEDLQNALESDDQQAVLENVAKNFVADFFTLSNKSIKNDIGGTQFWSSDARIVLRNKAIDTFYTNLELYIDDYGSENLPTVNSVIVEDFYQSLDDSNVYIVCVSWTYEENSVFDTSDFQKYAVISVTTLEETPYVFSIY